MQYHLSNMVMSWGEAVFRYIDMNGIDESCPLYSCVVSFGDNTIPTHIDGETGVGGIEQLIDFAVDVTTASSNINVKSGYLLAGRRADNAAERDLSKCWPKRV